ncbi:hypothetical protein SAMN05216505_105272 [Streptomyces prasinopilosus]|uniref:Uncharacterized protein n=1 Tax=Streptomyces prasinopilosus TaxID=67344 RepID=A0A1G6SCB5_9ACTN|nr:hypothetical protein SAMN05216505_105272 [Streptomyces prasinopilosus]
MLPGGTVESTNTQSGDTLHREAAEEAQLAPANPVRMGWVPDETGEVYGGRPTPGSAWPPGSPSSGRRPSIPQPATPSPACSLPRPGSRPAGLEPARRPASPARGGDGARAVGPAHRSPRRHRGDLGGGEAAELTRTSRPAPTRPAPRPSEVTPCRCRTTTSAPPSPPTSLATLTSASSSADSLTPSTVPPTSPAVPPSPVTSPAERSSSTRSAASCTCCTWRAGRSSLPADTPSPPTSPWPGRPCGSCTRRPESRPGPSHRGPATRPCRSTSASTTSTPTRAKTNPDTGTSTSVSSSGCTPRQKCRWCCRKRRSAASSGVPWTG